MTIWAIIDGSVIINVVDDRNGRDPVVQYVPNQTQVDLKSLPDGVWSGHELVDGQWSPPSVDVQPVSDKLAGLSREQLKKVSDFIDTVKKK